MVVVGGVIPAQDYQFYLMLTVAVLDLDKISDAAIKIQRKYCSSF
jgi:hypothetical protein